MTPLRPRPRTALATCAVVATGALAACGGGDSQTLSKHDLIVKGDGICATGQKRFADVGQAPPTSAKQAAQQSATLVASATEELNGLKALNAPTDLQPKLDAYLKTKAEALDLLKQRKEAADKADENAYGQVNAKLAKGQPERLRLAEAVGFKKCSRPVAAVPAASGSQGAPGN